MTGNNLCHSIRKQDFEVKFNGTESEGLILQRSLPELCYKRLIPAIEKALDRYAPANTYLTIDRLEIDAGSVTLDRLERDLPQMVDRALGKYFEELPRTDELSEAPNSAHMQRKTIEQTIIAAFIFFLKHGTLPWSFHLPSGSVFEELILNSLKEMEKRASSLELIKNEVIDLLASATARKRLIQQFTPALPETVLALISTEGRNVISGILPLLRHSDATLIDAKQVEQEVWECVFAGIASGSPLTEEHLRRKTIALVKSLGVRGASLAALLDSCWSQQSEGADEVQTADSSTAEGAGQSHMQTGKEDQAKLFNDPASLSQRRDGVEEDAQTVLPDERTMQGSETTEREQLAHPETGKEDQTKCLTEPTNSSQRQGCGADKAQNVVHHESKTPDSVRSKGEEPSDLVRVNNQAKSLSAPTGSSRQSERSVAEEKELLHPSAKAKEPVSQSAIVHPDAKAGIYTGLAGLVLLHPFLPQLFRALGIADDEKLLQPVKAINLLYFLATGHIDAKEYELVIPKLLCHFPLERAVESNVSLADSEQEEAIALLAAVIRHWEVLKNTGAEGLRETFLKRSGKLSLLDNGEWLLQVESNACDILLEQLPWGISMIKLPWMPEMLRVEWM